MKPRTFNSFFLIIDFDGINVGVRDSWNQTYLEFSDMQEAQEIAFHWLGWICGYGDGSGYGYG